ncbi:DUF6479 family protein [Streptomyces sp. CB00455]|uniref:DUF6479 family protein n=1 Tax=Streptomyces sp. CB00455 TaxID=1703927 RepID=UPI000939EF3A|nr:DUF6479 family protein [Streptomyces sp. CB00455]
MVHEMIPLAVNGPAAGVLLAVGMVIAALLTGAVWWGIRRRSSEPPPPTPARQPHRPDRQTRAEQTEAL